MPKLDWGSTRRNVSSVATPLIALLALKGIDVAPAFQSTLSVVDAIVAASGPFYALISNVRAMLKDHHAAQLAKVAPQPPTGFVVPASVSPTAPSQVLGQ